LDVVEEDIEKRRVVCVSGPVVVAVVRGAVIAGRGDDMYAGVA